MGGGCILIVILINKIEMMTNNNYLSPKAGQMNSSSMFYANGSNDNRKNMDFMQRNTHFDPYQVRYDTKAEKIQESKAPLFPKALASQSMIDMNSTSSARRSAFGGKLDSMARKVTPSFQEDSPHENKKPVQTHNFPSDNPAQSMMIPKLGGTKNLSSNHFRTDANNGKITSLFDESTTRKRRESIDLAGLKKQQNHDLMPFMRRAKNPEENKVESPADHNGNGDGQKSKNNFQFLKKRRETALNQQSTTASMIVSNHNHNVHSMKDLGQFSNNNGTYKKPDFLSNYQNHQNTHSTSPNFNSSNTLQIPTFEGSKKLSNSNVEDNSSPSRNFEFKKKKISESPIEPTSAKPFSSKEPVKREMLTMRQKLAMKNQREITLDDFQLLEKLGKGAFGDVYMAQEKHIGFICVIKKMSKKRIRETKVEEHILREIKIQSYLNHPNLTSLFGYFHDEEYLYLVLEALPDGSLQNVKKKKKLPQKEAAAIIKQVAEGLKEMHQEYIIHRDLKPENLFVNQDVVKIGDFGCSIYNRNLALRNTVVGCLEYSSPEQLSKEGYSQKIDSWSLGIMTYQMLFGKSPFGSDIIKLASNKELKPELSSLSFPPNIPIKDDTKRFIQNLLEADPDNRMDMDEVLHDAFLAEQVKKKPVKLEI